MYLPTKDFKLRGADPTGNGWYGAKRGNRKHKGLDVVVDEGEPIQSPINGEVVRTGVVYTFTRQFTLVVLKNHMYEVKLMYVKPLEKLKKGMMVTRGMVLGHSQGIATYWGKGMTNHIHIEVKKYGLLTDPEPLFIPNCD